MGDRAIIEFKFKRRGAKRDTVRKMYLYTHWEGSRAAEAAEAAVCSAPAEERGCYGDQAYFARIVLQQILRTLGANPDHSTGFGLSPFVEDHDDGDHGVVGVVDCSAGTFTRTTN